ncbi:ArsR/SmtB family transcription factor [Nocardiopsis changdeensis]|uniref:Winged helix-turn-helix transcriptional regulator n=1 Tax=Nocardiopsis changdeensis TaxID=2831969 RepID=A0ABX8BGK3_9ACTN|nr:MULTISPECIES: metalloregulator ArsR/SmtB family transcription factor [Nocardiopsis]QUX20474.1 winged helix-turn-helix transcriptional regulator [Nocardiopsis changdeensis]QYX36405.1 metalloregulator ArsR/SmtB family transcription factor [Nocardiopsis sp. MT53]
MSSDSCDLLCLDLPQAEAVRAVVPADEDVRAAAERAHALADPTRLRIARALAAGGELCVCDLAWVCSAAQNLVSHHVRRLRAAGLAASRRDGKLVMYRLTDTGHALLSLLLPEAGPVPAAGEG